MMVVMMFILHLGELLPADRFLGWAHLRFSKGKNLVGPDSMHGIFDKPPVVHHAVYIAAIQGCSSILPPMLPI